jgi:putative flippase GtrA
MRFAAVGALGIAVQVSTVGLLAGAHLDYRWATAAGVLAAIVHNFFWHTRWTWRDRPRLGSPTRTFLAFSGGNGAISLSGNLVVVYVLVGMLKIPPVSANLAAIATCALINFALADKAIFRPAATEC